MKRIICSSTTIPENVQTVLNYFDRIPEPTHVEYSPNGYKCFWHESYKLYNFKDVMKVFYLYDGDIVQFQEDIKSGNVSSLSLNQEIEPRYKKLFRQISKETGIKCKLDSYGELIVSLENPLNNTSSEYLIGLYDKLSGNLIGYYREGTSDWSGRTAFCYEDETKAKKYSTSRSAKLAWNGMYGYEEIILYKSNGSAVTYEEVDCEFRVISL